METLTYKKEKKGGKKKIKITEIIDPVLKNCFGLDS